METTDQELFDAAMSDAPAQETVAEVVQPEAKPAIARDEAGRFAAREAGEDEAQPSGEEPAPAGTEPKEPPPHRFREVSERARQAEERAASLERLLLQATQGRQPEAPAATPKPEMWDDPDKWVGEHIGTVKTEVQQTREFYSRKFAEQAHGAEKVDEAHQALDAAVRSGAMNGETVRAQLAKSMDPYGDIMAWHEKHKILSDPKAYEQQIIERFLADPATQARVAELSRPQQQQASVQPAGSVIKLPPSLNRTTSASASQDAPAAGDMSDAALFAHATAPRR